MKDVAVKIQPDICQDFETQEFRVCSSRGEY